MNNDEFRGKWKVVELTDGKIVENGLSYDEAVNIAGRLHMYSQDDTYQYDVQPSRKRKY